MPPERDSGIFRRRIPVNMIKNSQAEIIHKQRWNEYILLEIYSPGISSQSQPGQFIMIRINSQLHPLLRRPFSIHSTKDSHIEIFFQSSGLGTSLLSQKKIHDRLDILGPLGKGFFVDESLRDKEVVLIGGGRGIAPLFFLAQTLHAFQCEVKIFYGGKTHRDLPLKERLGGKSFDLYCSTDDGSYGYKGYVSHLFETSLPSLNPKAVFACGPEEMMKKISYLSEQKKIPAQFSLESMMGCGIGACWGCVRRVKKKGQEEWIKTCEEGPVFRSEEIVWT